MKFDMHCHTREGSVDGRVPIEEYITRLEQLGFRGMLVTDHDSYNGYREWKKNIRGKGHKNFIVLKGIEYDTSDAGHILVIMPEGVKIRVLELRGMPLWLLMDVVHKNGGILGPAHPYGERYVSLVNTKKKKNKDPFLRKVDFIETFNACETAESNRLALQLAKRFGKPGFGGSDAHRYDCIGSAYTELPREIRRESDLIRYIQDGNEVTCGGTLYTKTTKEKMGKSHELLVQLFAVYNKTANLYRSRKRSRELEKIYTVGNTQQPLNTQKNKGDCQTNHFVKGDIGGMAKKSKTNVMRVLDKNKIPYETLRYECDAYIDGMHTAAATGVPVEQSFKTLVACGKSGQYYVFVIPVAEEMDLKKAAKAAGEKSVAMIHVKEITAVTGYVRGGCSPVGMKKAYPTWIHESARLFEQIYVSGGRIGTTVSLDPAELLRLVRGSYADLC